MAKKVFIFSFIVACVIQGFIFIKLGVVDFECWAEESQYVQTQNPAQFSFTGCYGHPGGPLIEGTIFLHTLFDLSYLNALLIFIIFLNGLAIAGVGLLCYLMSKDSLWWLTSIATLSSSWVYIFSTPPSITVSLLISFLMLFSLYINRQKEIEPLPLIFLTILIGLIVSIRIDVGSFVAISFLIFLKPKISWRKMSLIVSGAILVFILFDPFMWFAPIRHISDIIIKIIYQYKYYEPSKISTFDTLRVLNFSLVSIFLSMIFLLLKEKIKPPLEPRFIYTLIIISSILCLIFFTSQYQALRYFLPIINIWQTLLPLLIFSLTTKLKPVLSKNVSLFFVVTLTLYPFIALFFYF